MRIVCVSDTHNRGIYIPVPPGDVLVHAGDLTVRGEGDEVQNAAMWLESLVTRFRAIVFTPGNHDYLFENKEKRARGCFTSDKIHCLMGQEVVVDGLKFYGTPVTRRFYDWAFNVDADKLHEHWSKIPHDTDVLVTHQPPHGIGDLLEGEYLGDPALREYVERLQPRLHVFGHIHAGHGKYFLPSFARTTFVNAAILDERYQIAHNPIVVDV